jgi:PHD/YefM family antitoxin component YafN of YafNO toxin-antitoxin module
MTEVTENQFEKNFDQYMERIENGEEFLIRLPDGKAVCALPADEYKNYFNYEELDVFNNHYDAC